MKNVDIGQYIVCLSILFYYKFFIRYGFFSSSLCFIYGVCVSLSLSCYLLSLSLFLYIDYVACVNIVSLEMYFSKLIWFVLIIFFVCLIFIIFSVQIHSWQKIHLNIHDITCVEKMKQENLCVFNLYWIVKKRDKT